MNAMNMLFLFSILPYSGYAFVSWNINLILLQYYEVFRNYNAYIQHRRLYCTTFNFMRQSKTKWAYQFSGVANRTKQLRVFNGVLNYNNHTPVESQCMQMTAFAEDDTQSDSSFSNDLSPDVNTSSLCVVAYDENEGLWYILSDTSQESTFHLLHNLADKKSLQEMMKTSEMIFPNITFQPVLQNCSFHGPPHSL